MRKITRTERTLRISVAFITAVLCLVHIIPRIWDIPALLIAAGLLLTGLGGYCPVNPATKKNVRKDRVSLLDELFRKGGL